MTTGPLLALIVFMLYCWFIRLEEVPNEKLTSRILLGCLLALVCGLLGGAFDG
jgi:hypothetical protein